MSLSNLTEEKQSGAVLAKRSDGWRSTAKMLSVLFKSRIVALLVLAAIAGAFLGAGGWPGIWILLLVMVSGWMAASGAAGLNEYIERGSDALMGRTRGRPLVHNQVKPRWVLWTGILLIVIPSLVILPYNRALSFFLILGAFIYVCIYTLWLKPRTSLNIVIGGAAGSAAVLSGAAAVGAWQEPAVLALAGLIFLWTPSHFWSLAILYRNDYARADVPMLPVNSTTQGAAWWVFLHTGAAALVALLLIFTPDLGIVYLIPVAIASIDMVIRNIRLIRDPTPSNARALFLSSNLYLMIVLLSICIGTAINGIWLL
jgi:protoheme IX farnesyltransferase